MGTSVAERTKVAERRQAVLDILKERPRAYYTSAVISDRLLKLGFDVSDDVVRLDIRNLVQSGNREIVSERGMGYMWLPEREEKPIRYGENKTEEGVNDPTAFQAMRKVENGPTGAFSPMPGEIWEIRTAIKDDPDNLYFVVRVVDDIVFAIKVGSKVAKDGFPNDPAHETIVETILGVNRLIDVRNFRVKPLKYFKTRLCVLNLEDICGVKDLLAEMLELVVVDHEPAVETPAPESTTEMDVEEALNMLLIKQERDIYKSIVDRFLECKSH